MYICNECGYLREELNETYEFVGNFSDGNNGYYELDTICSCGGEYVEAKKCAICGEWFDPDTLYDGICEECLKEETTEENAFKLGEECKESVEINGFLKSVFKAEEIEQILKNAYEELPQYYKNKYATDYCLEDIEAFAETLNNWKNGI